MADKFDWKKVLKTPFSKQESRSGEVLFLPTEESGRPTASFDTLSTHPSNAPAEYQPSAPLVLPAANPVGAWGADAFTPGELASIQSSEPVSVPPVMDFTPPVAPFVAPVQAAAFSPAPLPGANEVAESLTPIQVSGWQDAASTCSPACPPVVHPVEATAPPEEAGTSTFGPYPTQQPQLNRADDILARFGVQRAAPRHAPNPTPNPSDTPGNDILGDLERLLAGIAPEQKAEAPGVTPIELGEIAHEPVDAVAEPFVHVVESPEPSVAPVNAEETQQPAGPTAQELLASFGVAPLHGEPPCEPVAAETPKPEEPSWMPKPVETTLAPPEQIAQMDLAHLLQSLQPPAVEAHEPQDEAGPPQDLSDFHTPTQPPTESQETRMEPVAQDHRPTEPDFQWASLKTEPEPEETPIEPVQLVPLTWELVPEADSSSLLPSEPVTDESSEPDFPAHLIEAIAPAAAPDHSAEYLAAPSEPEPELVNETSNWTAPVMLDSNPLAYEEHSAEDYAEPFEKPQVREHYDCAPEPEEEPAIAAQVTETGGEDHSHFDLAALLAHAAANRGTDFIRVGPLAETCPVWFRTESHFEHVHDFSSEEGRGIWAWFTRHAHAIEGRPGIFALNADTNISVGFAKVAGGEMLIAHVGKSRSGPTELDALGLDTAEAKNLQSAARAPHGLIVVSAPAGQSARPLIEGVVACWNRAGRQTAWLGLPPSQACPNILSAPAGIKPEDTLAGLMATETGCLAIDDLNSSALADLASQAVIQGRLVCVGVTSADGWSALARLAEFGFSPYLLSSAVRGIASSRSVRALCPHCKHSRALTQEQKEKALGIQPDALFGSVWAASGCDECNGSGYVGYVNLNEVVKIDEEASRLIAHRSGPASFRAHYAKVGQKGMAQSALAAVLDGSTSWEQVEGLIGG